MVDKLRDELFHAAPEEEIPVLRRLDRALMLARGTAVAEIQNIKMIKCGAD